MAALGTYGRIVIKGTGPGSEIWMTHYDLMFVTPPADAAALATANDALAALTSTWWTAIKPTVFTSYSLTEQHAYLYVPPSTSAALGAVHLFTPVPGTQASTGSPIDTCCVVSTRSNVPGRSSRGRMYVPCHSAVQPTTGLFTTAPATYSAATGAMLSGIDAAVDGQAIIVSRATGTQEPVFTVTADQKPDVQRRRENRLSSGTVTTTVVTI